MSSYLNFYIKKKSENKYIHILSMNSSSNLYGAFRDYCKYNNDNKTLITNDILQSINEDILGSINNMEMQLETYRSYPNLEVEMKDIIETRKFIIEYKKLQAQIEFISYLVDETKFDHCNCEGVYIDLD